MLPENEILQFLKAIEAGKIRLKPIESGSDFYSGNQQYVTSHGWEITIFIDAGEWDYIDRIKTADNQEWEHEYLDEIASVRNYKPTIEAIISYYKLDRKFN